MRPDALRAASRVDEPLLAVRLSRNPITAVPALFRF